jgi:hypothetical protein
MHRHPLPWYRLPVRVPAWFALLMLAGWGVVLWRGVVVSLARVATAPQVAPDPRPPLASFVQPMPGNPYR